MTREEMIVELEGAAYRLSHVRHQLLLVDAAIASIREFLKKEGADADNGQS